jgi:uncharacterized membrane protein (UPF0182 family)
MDLSLEGALSSLLLAEPGEIVVEEDGETAVSTETDTDTTPVEVAPIDASVEELISSANAHFEAAQAAQQNGDWATYGAELEALENDLARLIELTGTP